jgi:sugar diacid utilization regulator/putative methionine-R-sulfoxide reductase with GAF domain
MAAGSSERTTPGASALRSALDLAAHAPDVDWCCLAVRRDPGDPISLIGDGHVAGDELLALTSIHEIDELVGLGPRRWAQALPVPGYEAVAVIVEGGDGATSPAALPTIAAHLTALMTRDAAGTRHSAYEAMLQIGAQIQADEPQLDAVLASVVDTTRRLIGTDVSWLAFVDEDSALVRVKIASGARMPEFLAMEVELGTGIGGIAVDQERTVYVPNHEQYGHDMPESVHRALAAEGVVSVLCAPMAHRGVAIGALYAGSREPTRFASDSAALLGALASQAAIAIANARLYETLTESNRALQSAVDVHRALTDASLAGAGLQELVDELARILSRGVCLQQDVVGPTRIWSPTDEATDPIGDGVPVMAGGAQLGSLHALGAAPLSGWGMRVLERGATVVALELIKQQAAVDVEWRLRGELLEEILQSQGDLASATQRAERLGVDLGQPRCVVILEPTVATQLPLLLDHLRRTGPRRPSSDDLLIGRHGSRVVLALAAGTEREAVHEAGRLRDRATRAGIVTRAAISATGTDLRRAHDQAEAAMRFAAAAGATGLVQYTELGPLRFLLTTPDITELSALVVGELEPLAAYDRREGSGHLMDTLRAYVDAGGHHRDAAERCHIHGNTLKYRLSRIADVMGCSLTDPEQRFRLKLAFEVRDILLHAGCDPLADAGTPGARSMQSAPPA